jgi:hypothetical protein
MLPLGQSFSQIGHLVASQLFGWLVGLSVDHVVGRSLSRLAIWSVSNLVSHNLISRSVI